MSRRRFKQQQRAMAMNGPTTLNIQDKMSNHSQSESAKNSD